MHRISCSGLIPGLVLLGGAMPATPKAAAQATRVHLPAIVDSARGYLGEIAGKGFTGVALVRFQGVTLLREGYGFADCAGTRRMNAAAVLDIGSITKAMTGVAVLQLAAEGRLSLHDSIGRYWANVPPDKAGITIEQLLRHTGG